MTRLLAVCADDFGLTTGISAGIARLAHAQRLTAVSCITNSPHWAASARLLRGLPASIEVGLHLNFTDGRPLSPRLARRWPRLPGPVWLLAQAHLRLLPISQLRNEVHEQLAAFNEAAGRTPAFIAGHRHMHHLPGLREIILDMAEHVQPLPALRSTGRLLGAGDGLRRWLVEHGGGRALDTELGQRVIAHNPALLGAYDFRQTDYGALVRGWLAALPEEGGLLFCHPGKHLAADPADPIGAARERELAYLGSAAFGADLAAAGVALGQVWQHARQVERVETSTTG